MPQRRDHVVRIQPLRVIYIDVGQSNHAFSIDEKCGRHGQVLRVIGAVEEIERMAVFRSPRSASIMASATPVCSCTTQKHLTVKIVSISMA